MRRNKRLRREFTAEFREEAVKLMNERLDEGQTLAQVGRDIDIAPDTLRKWAKDLRRWRGASEAPLQTDPSKMSDTERDQEIRRLRRELETVKQERDFLKKATAFFAKESQ